METKDTENYEIPVPNGVIVYVVVYNMEIAEKIFWGINTYLTVVKAQIVLMLLNFKLKKYAIILICQRLNK